MNIKIQKKYIENKEIDGKEYDVTYNLTNSVRYHSALPVSAEAFVCADNC